MRYQVRIEHIAVFALGFIYVSASAVIALAAIVCERLHRLHCVVALNDFSVVNALAGTVCGGHGVDN